MKKIDVLIAAAVGLLFISAGQVPDIPDVTPEQAFEMLKEPNSRLIDVRTVAEYFFVGHPEGAFNIPLLFWDETSQGTVPNPNFIGDIRFRLHPEDRIFLICRSGGRSARAARILAEEGFIRVFNVMEGFEGDMDERGFRTLNGWKNAGLPFTTEIDPDLKYRPAPLKAP